MRAQNNCFIAAKHVLTSRFENLKQLTLHEVYKIDLSGIEFPQLEILQMFHCGEIVMQHIIEGSHKTLKNLTISKSFYGNPLMKEEANSRDIPDLLKLETLVIHAPLNEFISSIVKLPCGDLKNLDISVRDKGYEFDGLHLSKLEDLSIDEEIHLYFNPILEQCAESLKRLQLYLAFQEEKKEIQLSITRLPSIESLSMHGACGHRITLYGGSDSGKAPTYKYIVSLCQPTLIHLSLGEFHYDEISGMHLPRLKHFSGYFDENIDHAWKFLNRHARQLESLEICLSDDNLQDRPIVDLPELEVLVVSSLLTWGQSKVSLYLPKLKDVYVNIQLSIINDPSGSKEDEAERLLKEECETVEFIVEMGVGGLQRFDYTFPNAHTVILPARSYAVEQWRFLAPKAKIITNFQQAKAAILRRARSRPDRYQRDLIKEWVDMVSRVNEIATSDRVGVNSDDDAFSGGLSSPEDYHQLELDHDE